MTVNIETVLLQALGQQGDRYVFGAETQPKDNNPEKFDCSELVQWACNHVGVEMVDGAQNQYNFCKQHGTTISIDDAMHTRGALAFITEPNHVIGHVFFLLGDGRTMEAKGAKYGVGVFSARNASGHPRFDKAARIPGIDYSAHPQLPPPHKPGDPAIVSELIIPDGSGGWRLHADGGIFTWGKAPYWGSLPGLIQKGLTKFDPHQHAVKLATRPGTLGYTILTNIAGQHYDFGPDLPQYN